MTSSKLRSVSYAIVAFAPDDTMAVSYTHLRAHEELVEAVRRHDPEGAREIMLAHLSDFEKRLRRRLAERTESDRPTTLPAPRLVRAHHR